MNKDLLLIEKKYGKGMDELCRDLFPDLLETEGLLPQLLDQSFGDNDMLYNDLKIYGLETNFKGHIYSLVDSEKTSPKKSPTELLQEVGYDLYVIKSDEELQSFRKYYAKNEQLSIFRFELTPEKVGHIFMAVKKNIDDIKREKFSNSKNQDEYDTSIICIDFSADENKNLDLDIYNRYNHEDTNYWTPFSNNLDNIVPGLTEAFEETYNMVQKDKYIKCFEKFGYVIAPDEKIYKYNYEINNTYYCPNNIIISNDLGMGQLPKDEYIVFDYFILSLKDKKIDSTVEDSFIDTIGNIKNIEVTEDGDCKSIAIQTFENKEVITIELNKQNQIISYTNRNAEFVGSFFLSENNTLKELSLPKAREIGDCFLMRNNTLKELSLPKAREIGDCFLIDNKVITQLDISNVESIGDNCLCKNNTIKELSLPKVKFIGNRFCFINEIITQLYMPNVETIGNNFLRRNNSLTQLYMPNLRTAEYNFLLENKMITQLYMPIDESIESESKRMK